jgi:hypothetical protein
MLDALGDAHAGLGLLVENADGEGELSRDLVGDLGIDGARGLHLERVLAPGLAVYCRRVRARLGL